MELSVLISLMQFDAATMDLLWIFNVVRYLTYDYHKGLRGRLDIALSICLGLGSLGAALVHEIVLGILLFLFLLVLTVWCLAYVLHDQLKIWDRTTDNKSAGL